MNKVFIRLPKNNNQILIQKSGFPVAAFGGKGTTASPSCTRCL